jgi:plastocyanin
MKYALVTIMFVLFSVLGVEAGEVEGQVVIESGVSERAKNSNPNRKSNVKKYGLKSATKEAKLGGLPPDEKVDERDFVVVYLTKEKDGAKLKATPRDVEIVQEKRRFFDHVTAMPLGSTVKFANKDKFYHHIYSPNSSKLDVPEHRGVVERKPDVVGEYELFCDIHPLMNAYLFVVPNDQFAVAKGGKFSLKGVPPGNYVLKAWHPRLKTKSYDVKVGDGKSAVKVTL